MMNYISTRSGNSGTPKNFEDVLLEGLAPDGGLYLPETFPSLDLAALKGKSYTQIAHSVMYPFVEGCIESDDFANIINAAYGPDIFRHADVVPLHKLDDNIYILEQFYGPTIAFKDVALQLLGRLFDHVLTKRGEHATIVGATSGDTGSAAIEGCLHCAALDIFILHPKGRVSDVQRRQMTTVAAPNVHNIAIEGSFDDCQNMVKAMFNDHEFRDGINMSAVNSINWARIMAQIVYYVSSALELGAPDEKITYVVPTGNFGNVFAAYCARKMGLPINLVVATNRNDILTQFFQTGDMRVSGVAPTISPSMDIEISSNFERYLFDMVGHDAAILSTLMGEFKNSHGFILPTEFMNCLNSDFTAHSAQDDEMLKTIKDIYIETGYVIDPHTAVAAKVALDIQAETEGVIVALATAHPSKFPTAVNKAIKTCPPLPDHLSDLFTREERLTELPNDLKTVQNFILSHTKQ